MGLLLAPIENTSYVSTTSPAKYPGYVFVDSNKKQQFIKSNYTAVAAPGVTDDAAHGYTVGSSWVDTLAGVVYTCTNSANGASVWANVSSAAIPAGVSGSIQYNDGAGAFAGSANATLDENGAAKLHRLELGTVTIPSEVTSLYIQQEPTTITEWPIGAVIATTYNPTANSGQQQHGALIYSFTKDTNNKNVAYLFGTSTLVKHYGSGTITGDAVGLRGDADNFGAGLITRAIGVQGFVGVVGTGNITTGYGLYAPAPTKSSTGGIGTFCGLRIDTPTVGDTNWAVSIQGGDSHFGGNTRFGSAVAPTCAVDVTGEVHVSQRVEIGAPAASEATTALQIGHVSTTAAAWPQAQMNVLEWNPTANNSQQGTGFISYATIKAGNDKNCTYLFSGRYHTWHYGTGTLDNAVGTENSIVNRSSGTITTASAVTALISAIDTGGITTAYGFHALAPVETSTGAIGTYAGLYIETPTVATTNWAIAAAGGNSYFAGNTRFGSAVAPTVAVDVTGQLQVNAASGSPLIIKSGDVTVLEVTTNGYLASITNVGLNYFRLVTSDNRNLWFGRESTGAYISVIEAQQLALRTDNTDRVVIGAAGEMSSYSHYPLTDDTYYLGKNDDDAPKAWKGVILKDTTNGKYYRIEVISGTLTATDLTD